jgi:hypothetical protein
MIPSQTPSSDRSSNLSNTYPLRLDGHMCDGVGTTAGPEPGAVLCANADEIWLKGRRGDFRIPRSGVVRIGRGRMYPWFFRGIRIRHNIAGFPSELQFGPFVGSTRDLIAKLKSLGYPTG